jgi:RNA polymerase sigma-70 factor (ECF subfamily)
VRHGAKHGPPEPSQPGGRGRTSSEPDEALERLSRGDQTALATLYDLLAQRVYDIAYWILQDCDEAEDVVEETFLQAWRRAGEYDWRRASAATWLAIIARSRAIDRLRARRRAGRRQAPAPGSLADAGKLDPEKQPDALQERADLRRILVDAVGRLPAEQRRVVELAYFEGLTHMEVAARTEIPLGTVKTRIRLGMKALRELLSHLGKEAL